MVLVDSTIVAIAMPAITLGLDAGLNGGLWVNSAYLLAFAVPLLLPDIIVVFAAAVCLFWRSPASSSTAEEL